MVCTLQCHGYISERKYDSINDLYNPFITSASENKKKCKCVYKKEKNYKKDDLLLIFCLMFALLFCLIKIT